MAGHTFPNEKASPRLLTKDCTLSLAGVMKSDRLTVRLTDGIMYMILRSTFSKAQVTGRPFLAQVDVPVPAAEPLLCGDAHPAGRRGASQAAPHPQRRELPPPVARAWF